MILLHFSGYTPVTIIDIAVTVCPLADRASGKSN